MIQQLRSVKQTNHWLDHVINFITVHPDRRTQLGGLVVPIETAHADLINARAEVKDALNRRKVAVTTCQDALRELSQYCGDARALLSRRFSREKIDEKLLKDYELEDTNPNAPTSREWLGVTRELLVAEAQAVAAGVTPMAFPSATELQDVLDTALIACADVDDAVLKHRDAADRLRSINVEVGELVLDTAAWFRFSLRRYSKPAQRDIMRRFGFVFLEGSSAEDPATDPGPIGVETPGQTPSGGGNTPPQPTGTGQPDPSTGNSGNQTNQPTGNSGGADQSGGNSSNQPTGNSGGADQSGGNSSNQPTGNSGGADQSGGSSGNQPTGNDGGSDQSGGNSGSPSTPTTGNTGQGGDRDNDAPKGDTTQTPPILGGDLDNGRNNLMDGNVMIALDPSFG